MLRDQIVCDNSNEMSSPRTDPEGGQGGQGGGGGGGYSDIFIHRLGHSFVFKILNFIIFCGFQKNEYFLGYEDFVDIFWGSSQNWTKFSSHFYAF